MGKKSREKRQRAVTPPAIPGRQIEGVPFAIQLPVNVGKREICDSLLDEMIDGQEYASILDKTPRHFDARNEIRRAMADVESVRKRPLIIYAANQIQSLPGPLTAITGSDNLPFCGAGRLRSRGGFGRRCSHYPEKVEGLQRALRRLWALLYWVFDKGSVAKIMLGQHFSLFRTLKPMPVAIPAPGGQP